MHHRHHTSADMPFDLVQRAWHAMREEGFEPELPPDAREQLATIEKSPLEAQATERVAPSDIHDLRHLLWSSVDNPESRDLDQVEWAQRLSDGGIRLLVGVADVDSRIAEGSPLDDRAKINTTSVYTGVVTFPMLPEELSTDRTSLNPDEARLAVVVDMMVAADGEVVRSDVYRAWVRNAAKLSYDAVGEWLASEPNAHRPEPPKWDIPGLDEQLHLQNEAAARLQARRERMGALDLQTDEAQTTLTPHGQIELQIPRRGRGRRLIENLMVAANSLIADFLSDRNIPAIQRIVRRPDRWPRIVALAEGVGETLPPEPDAPALSAFLTRRRAADPARFPDLSLAIVKLLGPGEYTVVEPNTPSPGHFGLAAPSYTHSTAPNRRYVDLIVQRQIKAALAHHPSPYNASELEALAAHCTERENAARKVERLMRKVAAAVLLHDRIGETFEAVVTGNNRRKGVFVRLTSPPVEGRIIAGDEDLDVGDTIPVRLTAVDFEKGWIDFARIGA